MNKPLGWVKTHLFALVLVISVVFRLTIAPWVVNGDLWTQAEWGQWMYTHGTKGLYEWNRWLNEWPNHPPLISMLYLWTYQLHSLIMAVLAWTGNFIALHRLAPTKFLWLFDFMKWYGQAKFVNAPADYLQGIVLTIKMQMIAADAVIGFIIYLICKSAKVDWKKYVLAYLFLPFSWYLSAWWGQSDQLAFVFLILAFILITKKQSWLSPVFLAIAINLKPTGLILGPLYLWIWCRQKASVKNLVGGGMAAVVITLWISSLFTDKQPVNFILGDLVHRLFLTKPAFTTVSAFNVWYIFHAKDLVPELTKYWWIPAKYWGYLAFAVILIISFINVKRKDLSSIFESVFMTGFGGWLVMTNMYERYVFAGVAALLLASIYRPKLFKYFVILSFIYLFNMYNGWWQPVGLGWLKDIFLANGRLATRILSAINIGVYLLAVKEILAVKKPIKH